MKLEEELEKLRKTKRNLTEKADRIRDELIEYQNALEQNKKIIEIEPTESVLLPKTSLDASIQEKKSVKKLTATTRNIAGFVYENANKKWLRDHVWLYEMSVVLKVLQFKLNLTVDKKKPKENEILDISCHFSNIDECCLNEITPWVTSLTGAKNFTLLMSAFSEYNDQSILRKKILNKLKHENIVTIEKCSEEGGGLIAYVHSPQTLNKPYVKYFWKLQLNPHSESIDNVFNIDVLDDDFVGANEELLKQFCKKEIKKSELEKLWCDLCVVVNEYKQ